MDVTLHEVDRLWKSKLVGGEYVGSALATSNLSLVERMWLVPSKVQQTCSEHVKTHGLTRTGALADVEHGGASAKHSPASDLDTPSSTPSPREAAVIVI